MRKTNAVGDPQKGRRYTENTPQLLSRGEVAEYERQGVVEADRDSGGMPWPVVLVMLPFFVVAWVVVGIADAAMYASRDRQLRRRDRGRTGTAPAPGQTRTTSVTVINNIHIQN